jgi:hypothetical protein
MAVEKFEETSDRDKHGEHFVWVRSIIQVGRILCCIDMNISSQIKKARLTLGVGTVFPFRIDLDALSIDRQLETPSIVCTDSQDVRHRP